MLTDEGDFMPNVLSVLSSDSSAILSAMDRSQAIIQFDLTGKILTANANFCTALGYELTEITGRHHSMFVDPAEAASPAYREFWANLARGEFDSRQYKRIGKNGREIWIEASYNPVFRRGKPYKVVKFATDITAAKQRAVEDAGKLAAISKSQAAIEFTPSGDILTANENFCTTVGYDLSEIVGKHHRMFCDPTYANSEEYRQFWHRLGGGEFIANEFVRYGKGGKEIWIQAAYNPIIDANGKVFKVVKFATDVSERMGAVVALGEGLRKLADGDLQQVLDKPFVPSMEKVRADFNEAVAKLRDAMRAVGENAHSISSGAEQIRIAAADLSKRTEQQAASVEETAAALEQITATVKDSSKRAEEAGVLVKKTRENAEQSSVVVTNAVAAMAQIDSSSREISNIISIIDEIAFQTNLLALNAGVEAARAGEAGRGFAVVAQEVRELAQRSVAAAKNIKDLIVTSGAQVEAGVSLVGQTGEALQRIVEQVQEINVNVTAIVEGAREQATSLGEVNLAVNSIDQGTQKNAAMVEESTAASHNLAREAQSLFELLGQFRTGAATVQAATRPAAATASSQAAVSPARQLARKVAGAFSGNAAVDHDKWEDF